MSFISLSSSEHSMAGADQHLEVLFPVFELVLVTFLLQYLPELRRPAKEHGDLSLLLLGDVLEHPIPVGSASIGAGLETGNQVTFRLKQGIITQ